MAERPAAARSRSVGRCDLLVEVAKSQLGSLWLATTPGALGLEPRWVRCLALGSASTLAADSVIPGDREALAALGRWSGGFGVQQAVSTLEVVVDGSDLALVSAYVPGETLRSVLRLTNFKRSSLPTRVALRVIVDVCEALLAAESRDASAPGGSASLWGGLLPDSILVGVDGTTRVLELGVAALWRQRSSEAQHPEVIAYCAPEQLDHPIVDARADVFILGILLWEMLTGGKHLFKGLSQRAVVERLRKHDVSAATTGSDWAAHDVDAATRALLNKMLAQDPGSRFGGILELKQAIEAMGDALAAPREVSDFVTRIAASALDLRERALERAFERNAQNADPERLLPPRLPIASDDDEIEVEETGSVRAEDIMAALAVEDTEPERDSAPGLHPARVAPYLVDPTITTVPPSSGRRASPTAVVVPPLVAAPDAQAFAPVPSVLQTLRGPGIPPPTFDFLRPLELPPEVESVVTKADPTSRAARLPSRGLSGLLAQGLPVRVVAALSGAAFVVVMGLVFALGGETESSDERGPAVMGARTSDSEQNESPEPDQAPDSANRAGARSAKPGPRGDEAAPSTGDARETAKGEIEASGDDTRTESATDAQAVSAQAETAAAAAGLAAADRVTRAAPARARSKRSSTTLRTTAKKKKLRATRTYIPTGI